MSHVTHPRLNSGNLDSGWQRLIGCLKLQVIFRKRATSCRDLLRKLTHKDKASYMTLHHPVPRIFHICLSTTLCGTGWRKPIDCLIFIRHFPQKSPEIRGFFAGNNLHLQASCTWLKMQRAKKNLITVDICTDWRRRIGYLIL